MLKSQKRWVSPLIQSFISAGSGRKQPPVPSLRPLRRRKSKYVHSGGVYNILEEATKTKSGIEAICTADAILCLWNWDSADDLRRARAAINHLIKRLEG